MTFWVWFWSTHLFLILLFTYYLSIFFPVAQGSKKLYVGNLSFDVTREQVQEFFSEFAEVSDTFLPVNTYGDPRGFGFITVKEEDVDKVLEATDGMEFMGRPIAVKLPLTPEEKQKNPRQSEFSFDYFPSKRKETDFYSFFR